LKPDGEQPGDPGAFKNLLGPWRYLLAGARSLGNQATLKPVLTIVAETD